MYTNIVMKHFENPQNVGYLENPDGIGVVGDPKCGDYIKIYIKVENDFIKDIKFKAYGCCAAIASTSITTVLAKDKPIMYAYTISDEDILNELGGLPEQKKHCSLLGPSALKKAIIEYAKKNKNK